MLLFIFGAGYSLLYISDVLFFFFFILTCNRVHKVCFADCVSYVILNILHYNYTFLHFFAPMGSFTR